MRPDSKTCYYGLNGVLCCAAMGKITAGKWGAPANYPNDVPANVVAAISGAARISGKPGRRDKEVSAPNVSRTHSASGRDNPVRRDRTLPEKDLATRDR